MTQRQSRVLLSLLSLIVFAVLIALGIWQLQRRDWKNELLTRLELGINSAPLRYEPPSGSEAASREFTHVRLQGRFRPEKSVRLFLAAPNHARGLTREAFGHLIFTPLEFEQGIVFINRGFVPQNTALPLVEQSAVTVTGIIRAAEKPGSFTPQPEVLKRVFYAADIPAMFAAAGLVKRTGVMTEYIEASPIQNSAQWPKARDPRELLATIPNRHLGYAATWFGLAATLLGVFGVYSLKL